MTIFVTWQIRVALDSISNSCNVLFLAPDANSVSDLMWCETVEDGRDPTAFQWNRPRIAFATAKIGRPQPLMHFGRTKTWIIGHQSSLTIKKRVNQPQCTEGGTKTGLLKRHSSLTVIIELGHNQMHHCTYIIKSWRYIYIMLYTLC